MKSPPSYRRFFAELKRRRVFRVMAVYGAVAFGVVQIADLAFPRLAMPDWTVTLVLLLVLLGFPIAIVLSWAFEQTPEGLKRTEKAPPEEISEIASAPAAQRWPIGIAAAGGTALLLIGAWWVLDGPGTSTAREALRPDDPVESIAVLPFADMSPEGDQAYFGDGLAEELLDALANIEGLTVAARTSSFRFRGADVDIGDVADRLGVQTILEGSVRSGGDRVRITAQLVNADGFHLWSESYDRTVDEMADLIGVQEEIAQSIVSALSLAPETAAGEPLETLVAQGTDNLEAYNAVLRGRHLMAQRTPVGLAGAVEQFERAVTLDPDYARAWADLSMATSLSYGWGFRRDSAMPRRSEEAVERALELDPRMAAAYTARGYIHSWIEYDSAKADRSFARAIELNPRFPTAYHWRGEILSDRGHAESGIPYLERARELDPLSPIILVDLAEAYDRAGRWHEADTLFAEAMALEPDFRPALQGLAYHAVYDADAPALLDYTERMLPASEGADARARRYLRARSAGAAFAARDYEAAVRHFRELVPTDTSALPQVGRFELGAFLFSLNEVEGQDAVRSFVEGQAPRLTDADSLLLAAGRGYAALLAGDTTAARVTLERLSSSEDFLVEEFRMLLVSALGDVEAAVAEIQQQRPAIMEHPSVWTRFFLDHLPVYDLVRRRPEFQAILEELPPYTGPRDLSE